MKTTLHFILIITCFFTFFGLLLYGITSYLEQSRIEQGVSEGEFCTWVCDIAIRYRDPIDSATQQVICRRKDQAERFLTKIKAIQVCNP